MKGNFELFSPLEIRLVDSAMEEPLLEFFEDLERSGDDRHFHPHPFTAAEAKRRANYSGKDLYYVLIAGHTVLGYGMLRGWDEGYEIPSLGIAIRASMRKLGLGKLLMLFLHAAAQQKGAKRIRLKVYSSNQAAVALYATLGYKFVSEEDEQVVGFLDL